MFHIKEEENAFVLLVLHLTCFLVMIVCFFSQVTSHLELSNEFSFFFRKMKIKTVLYMAHTMCKAPPEIQVSCVRIAQDIEIFG